MLFQTGALSKLSACQGQQLPRQSYVAHEYSWLRIHSQPFYLPPIKPMELSQQLQSLTLSFSLQMVLFDQIGWAGLTSLSVFWHQFQPVSALTVSVKFMVHS